jgi:hypothetical protein
MLGLSFACYFKVHTYHIRYVHHLAELVRARGKELAVRLAWTKPFLRYFCA